MDLDLNGSRYCVGDLGFGTDWSCGPQFAYVNEVMPGSESGNLMNASMADNEFWWNVIPNSLVECRYFIAYFLSSFKLYPLY